MTILASQLSPFPLSENHVTNAHDIDSGNDERPIISKEYYLFGHPISHSASPHFHNLIWSKLYPDRRYSLCDTANLTHEQIAKKINSDPKFDGAAITMPLKSMVMKIPGVIDRLTPSALATGAVNTIVTESKTGSRVGTNTDTEGIRRALLSQLPSSKIDAFEANTYAGFVIGSGATTRSAVYALSCLNLSPIYLINRDHEETLGVMGQFPHLDLRAILDEEDFEAECTGRFSKPIPIGVGCIPALEPVTDQEKMVYQLARAIFSIPYVPEAKETDDEFIKAPTRPLFLEMAYKPRQTPMLINAQASGWATIEGIQAMIEQGLSQSRMWITGNAEAVTNFDKNSGNRIIPEEIELEARNFVEGLGDL
ncbi:uncharacterized protein MELLADRAFT_35329 [Melampsora larici-populina 98AG31]|uniref:Shikimate dehydrogenase substrate binding N-terminal domain-containing protein n=1 Tax=Melampsora larici-populina (strain 98AG31 / pathotype 3-4-7) TaxID=747676 RepID=F4RIX5_MELLP|nr:uncharacterized protein MELLADRAFT_35329 [Melampsora larici-populina 98AG31]EGG07639.1 hypothetical protein MELLADRAFT_35329 [Melampsora larici-populina 98AG31]